MVSIIRLDSIKLLGHRLHANRRHTSQCNPLRPTTYAYVYRTSFNYSRKKVECSYVYYRTAVMIVILKTFKAVFGWQLCRSLFRGCAKHRTKTIIVQWRAMRTWACDVRCRIPVDEAIALVIITWHRLTCIPAHTCIADEFIACNYVTHTVYQAQSSSNVSFALSTLWVSHCES